MKIILLLIFLILGCTTQIDSPVAGTETTNGVATLSGTTNAQNSGLEVIARSIFITPRGDSIKQERKTTIKSNGTFTFNSLNEGQWSIILTKDDSISVQNVELKNDIEINLKLNKSQLIVGRIISPTPRQIKVFIPGTNIESEVDSNGFYQLEGVPLGIQDLAMVDGQRLNYLSLNIPESDTVFIRDVIMVSEPGEVTSEYAPFESSLNISLAVVPLFYSPLNQPDWYQGRDFDEVIYYEKLVDNPEPYTPDPQQILFVGNRTADDFVMVERLSSQGYSVRLKSDSEVAEADTLGMDLLYTSYSLNSNVVDTLFKNTSLPIIVNEANYGRKIGLVSAQAQETAQSIQISQSFSPLTEGLSGIVEVTTSPSTMKYGVVGSEATILASSVSDDQKAYIYYYEQGDALVQGIAPGKRIGFFASVGTAQAFNENGWKLFDNSIKFALSP